MSVDLYSDEDFASLAFFTLSAVPGYTDGNAYTRVANLLKRANVASHNARYHNDNVYGLVDLTQAKPLEPLQAYILADSVRRQCYEWEKFIGSDAWELLKTITQYAVAPRTDCTKTHGIVGRPVTFSSVGNRYRAYIVDAGASPKMRMVFGAKGTEKQMLVEYQIAYFAGEYQRWNLIRTTQDNLQNDEGENHLELGQVQALITSIRERDEKEAKWRAEEREAARIERDAFTQDAKERMPDWAKAVMVAQYYVEDPNDEPDDYYSTQCRRTVLLGFSRHNRNLFSEMRKMAKNFADTAHMADLPEDAEHRYGYKDNFLMADERGYNGWKIYKQRLWDGARSVPIGEWAEDFTGEPQLPEQSDGVVLNNSKHGIEIRITRKLTDDELAALSGHGFRWHRQGKYFYAKCNEVRQAFADSLFINTTERGDDKAETDAIGIESINVVSLVL